MWHLHVSSCSDAQLAIPRPGYLSATYPPSCPRPVPCAGATFTGAASHRLNTHECQQQELQQQLGSRFPGVDRYTSLIQIMSSKFTSKANSHKSRSSLSVYRADHNHLGI